MEIDDITTQVIAGVHILPRSLENPNLPLNDPKVWQEVFGEGATAETGETITAEKAFTIPAVWQAVNLISGDIAKLPLTLYSEGASGVRKEVRNNPLVRVVQERPNRDENAFKFWRRVMVHALIWNNAYVWAPYDRSNGSLPELFHLLPDRTTMRMLGDELWCITEVAGVKRRIPADEVMHIEGVSYDCLEGASLVNAARNSWALALAQEKFASKFFKHGGRVGGILEIPLGTPKTSRDTIEEGFRKTYEGADNPFKTVVLRDSAKFHAAQVSPSDSQLVEGTEQQVRQIARWFNISPSKLGLSDSVSYNSKSEDNQSYLDTTLSHWLKSISMEATLKLMSENQRRELWFEHDVTELLRMNPLQRSQYYNTMIASTVISPNEARRMENMEPYKGGDSYQNPNTSKGLQPEPATQPTPTKEKKSVPLKLARVMFHVCSNARHKAKRPTAFLEWIDGNLASHRQDCRESGIEETEIDSILLDFKQVAERASGDDLKNEINQITAIYESGLYEN